MNTQFSLQSLTGFRRFFLPMPWPQTPTHVPWSSCPRGKATVMLWSYMTSHMIDLTWLGQFQFITDPTYPELDLSISHLAYLINLLTFGSTFRINLLNQPTWSAFSLIWRRHWLVVHCFLWQTYVCGRVLLSTEVRMIQVVDLLADHPLVESWNVSPSSIPW